MDKHKKIIDIKSISHTFADGTIGINKVSLSIKKGEFVIITGKNGSGKTTFLKHLNVLLKPDLGQIFISGQNALKNPIQTRKTIGMVFQDADTQIVGDTVFDEVSFGPENLKLSRNEITKKVTKILKSLDLFHLKDKSPFSLSGGQKRKLALAGILVMDPKVIVFDEPFSNLDYPSAKLILSTIIDLHTKNHTIIIAAHNVEPLIYYATRIIVFENASIKEDKKPKDIVNNLESYGIREPCSSKLGLGIMPWHE